MAEKKIIKMNEKVTVYATEKAGYYAKGEAISVHPELAKKLIADGKATEKPVK